MLSRVFARKNLVNALKPIFAMPFRLEGTTPRVRVTQLSTLAAIATTRPESLGVLLDHRLDFFCSGKDLLKDACKESGINPEQILQKIDEEEVKETEDVHKRWDDVSLTELQHFIVDHFHNGLRESFPALLEQAKSTEKKFAEHEQCPNGLTDHLNGVWFQVQNHINKEENILFPLFDSGKGYVARGPVSAMEDEHVEKKKYLLRTRQLTNDLTPPKDADKSWEELYEGLVQFERDLMLHIHFENNILFPRALSGQR